MLSDEQIDPRFEGMTVDEVTQLMMVCALSNDPSDKEFAAACREEIKRRKPERAAGEKGKR